MRFLLLALSFSLFQATQTDLEGEDKHCKSNNWLSWGRDKDNSRHNKDSRIDTCSVKDLRFNWMRNLGGNIFASPAIEDGFMYVCDEKGGVWKLREKDGSTVWTFNIKQLIPCVQTRGPTGWSSGFSRFTPIVLEDRIIIGLRGPAWLMAIDKSNGGLLWTTPLDSHPSAVLTMSGSHADGVIYQGVSSLEELEAGNPAYPCCSFVGSMHAVEAATGRILWSTRMIPEAISGVGQFSGVAVWGSSPPVDERAVYIATGNLYELTPEAEACVAACDADPQSCIGKPPCVPESVHYNSVLALDRYTGLIIWATRLGIVDAWNFGCILPGLPNCNFPVGPDYDFGEAPILFGKDGLIVGQKAGIIWSLDRRNGSVRWSSEQGPGGILGGIIWGSTLVTSQHSGHKRPKYTYIAQNYNSNGGNFTLADGSTFNGGILFALDAETGKTLWQAKQPAGLQAQGPPSSTSEVVFAPRYVDGRMVAYSVRDGTELWNYKTNATLVCGATIVRDAVYFGNGYSPLFFGTPGGNLYAFKI